MLELLLTSVVPALLPAAVDGVRGIFNKITGGEGAKPANVEEVIKLGQLQIDKMKALAEIDRPVGTISRWVADLRASSRYILAGLIMAIWLTVVILDSTGQAVSADLKVTTAQMAQSAFFFLFGDRVYMHLRKDNP